ncbi:uncharacterized protein LOC115995951 [Ipomoea triloba]|uniref:uncharacterized protein LOC115995951 n=1 Tax=Ipomoea triloba TaxID=35885 RepID=UPI00125E1F1F|nr:uncharacterized protein LOC115995951 [Ipomoea triloba]
MARSGSNSGNSHGSRGNRAPPRAGTPGSRGNRAPPRAGTPNGTASRQTMPAGTPNGTASRQTMPVSTPNGTASRQTMPVRSTGDLRGRQTMPVRSTGDLRDVINSHRQGGPAPPPPPNSHRQGGPAPPPPPPAPGFQEGMVALRQATTVLTQILDGLQGSLAAAPPGPSRRVGAPSTRHPPTPEPRMDAEVNSPRPSARRGGDEAPRGRPTQRETGGARPVRATKSALGRLGTRVPVRERLDFGPHHEVPAEGSALRRAPSAEPRAASRHEQASRIEQSGETRGRPSGSPHNEMEQLRRRLDELQRRLEIGEGAPVPQEALTSPFTEDIMAQPLPQDLRWPTIKLYSGSSDPRAHINRYRAAILMMDASDAVMCRGFFATLDGQAQDWFTTLPEGSISSFADLSGRFLSHFASNIPKKKQFATMCKLEQGSTESLTDYLAKWKKEARSVDNFDENAAVPIFTSNVRSGPFHRDLVQNPPKTYAAFLDRATRFAEAEEAERKKKEEERGRRDKAPQEDRRAPRPPRQGPRLAPLRCLTPLTHPLAAILEHAEVMGIVSYPAECLKISPNADPNKYCRFHRQIGHDTEECMVLIEELIRKGYLGQYVKRPSQGKAQGPGNVWKKKGGSGPPAPGSRKRELDQPTEEEEKESDDSHPPQKKQIHVIFGGPEGGDTQSERKKWARSLYVGEVVRQPHEKKPRRDPIVFTDDDLPEGPLPHRDAVVIRLDINNIIVHRVLVDTGSSVNVMYHDTFAKLGLSRKQLMPVRTPLAGFTGDSIEAEGSINLEVEIGDLPHVKRWEVEFVIVRLGGAHNIILGRPALEDLRCVISMEHLCLKFPTPTGVGTARGDQKVSRSCYLKACRQIGSRDLQVHTIAEKALQGEENRPRAEPIVETEDVVLDLGRPERVVKVGTGLPAELRGRIIEVIRRFKDVFAWGPEDMPGLSREVITHKLAVDPTIKPIQQKKRYLSAERREFVKKEVNTLLEIGHVREVLYPGWLANVVLAPKPPTWRMCVDYTDLNKACPMDPFPLPNIDQLVDEIAGCALMSFLDAFRGYHQIFMHEEDEEKTAFTTPEGVFCYRVMAFGLKNSGATYTRMVAKVFKKVLSRNLQAYVDYMIVKSSDTDLHTEDLTEVFSIMRQFDLRLNPKKCTFGVHGGKFLGYMVSKRGIEPNPDKVKAILEMEPPRSLREVQRLNGRLAALGRFLSRSAEKSLPFFGVLKKSSGFEWSAECQKAFEDLKAYLMSLPPLAKPEKGELLYLYLGISQAAISSVLVRDDAGVQRPVYYVSRALRGAELRYSPTEKAIFAVDATAKKLNHYFQAHPVHVLTNLPLEAVLRRAGSASISSLDQPSRGRPSQTS